jgi:hypothetical protein
MNEPSLQYAPVDPDAVPPLMHCAVHTPGLLHTPSLQSGQPTPSETEKVGGLLQGPPAPSPAVVRRQQQQQQQQQQQIDVFFI